MLNALSLYSRISKIWSMNCDKEEHKNEKSISEIERGPRS
jgi:hypothetical protein